jgi:O-acetyl-ADP-ribose deacetylase (regulator of RNase III)
MKVIVGNALTVTRGIIVHGCNCKGVMGSGIARSVRELYPQAFGVYHNEFSKNGLKLGNITFAKCENDEKWIVNAQTQDGCGTDKRYVDYEAVYQCFEKVRDFAEVLQERGIVVPIVFPKIGAGLAGGNWMIIETMIKEICKGHELELYVMTEQEIPEWHKQ